MDAYEVHKKIQEALLAIEIYDLSSTLRSSMWDAEIKKGLDQLVNKRNLLFSRQETASESS